MEYPYSKTNVDLSKLQGELLAASVPVSNLLGGAIGSPDFTVVTLAPLDPAQVATMNSVIAAHDGRKRQKRTLAAILADVQALTGAQQTAVWNDLLSGAPPKWRSMSSDQCVWAKGSQATTSALEKQVAVSFFVRENVTYLVNPAWWPTTGSPGPVPNLPGDEPVVS